MTEHVSVDSEIQTEKKEILHRGTSKSGFYIQENGIKKIMEAIKIFHKRNIT